MVQQAEIQSIAQPPPPPPLSNNFLEILQKLQISHLKKKSLDGYFKLTTAISVILVAKQGWQTMVSTNLTKTGVGGGGLLYFIVGLYK